MAPWKSVAHDVSHTNLIIGISFWAGRGPQLADVMQAI
jgi:hypothetical protein